MSRTAVAVGLLIVVWAVLNSVALFRIGLFPDEAYYWVWSERLQAGYFDHGPLVAWLIRPFTEVFGDAPWAMRLPAVLSVLVGALVAWRMAGELYADRRAAVLAVLIWGALPIVQVGFHIVTPDTPLILFTWLAYYGLWRALRSGDMHWWLLAGAVTGLAMLGKYTAVLVPAAFVLGLSATREGRGLLAGGRPWAAAAVALAMVSPVVLWNFANDWISFGFQVNHGFEPQDSEPLKTLGRFIGGQLAVVLPWTFAAMAVAALRPVSLEARSRSLRPVLIVGFWLPLLFFGVAALNAEGEANWAAIAYVPGTLLLAGALTRWIWPAAGRVRKAVLFGVGLASLLALLFTNVVRYPGFWLGLLPAELRPVQRTQLTYTYGWGQAREELQRLLAALPDGGECRVLGNRHQTAAMVALLLGDAHRTGTPERSRFNQYHLWDRAGEGAGRRNCLYVIATDSQQSARQLDLGPQGVWERASVIEVSNPDYTERRFVFYRPLPNGD